MRTGTTARFAVVWDGRVEERDGELLTNSSPNLELYEALLDEAPVTLVSRPLLDGALAHSAQLNRRVTVCQIPRRAGPLAILDVVTVNRLLGAALADHTALLAMGPGFMASLSLRVARRGGIGRIAYMRNTMPGLALREDDRYARTLRWAYAATATVLDAVASHACDQVGAVSRAALGGQVGFVMPEIPYGALENEVARVGRQSESAPWRDEILYVGRLERVKGPDLAIRALAVMNGRRLTIVGEGSMRSRLSSLARELGVAHQVAFMGSLPHDKVLKLIGQYGCVVVPSRSEAFGLVALEAVAIGTPVVVTRVGGLPEAVMGSRQAIVVEPEPGAIAAGIRTALLLNRAKPVQGLRDAAHLRGWVSPEELACWLRCGRWPG